jgi:LacI family transcriptional regulator
MPATIKDVARAAGVSVATVSRALNGLDNVLPDTRQRILDAARELRFTPSGAARSLITRRTDTIGALLPDLHGEYFSELIRGIDQAARARGLHLLVSSSHGDADEAAAALRAMNGRVDGLLVMSPHADGDFLQHNLPGRLPAVLLNTGLDCPATRASWSTTTAARRR